MSAIAFYRIGKRRSPVWNVAFSKYLEIVIKLIKLMALPLYVVKKNYLTIKFHVESDRKKHQ